MFGGEQENHVMTMFERVMRALIGLVLIFILYWIIVYVIGALGIPLPPHVPQLVMVVLVLCGILYLYRCFAGSGFALFPPKQ